MQHSRDIEETYKPARRTPRPAHLDFILCPGSRTRSIITTALANRVKEVVVIAILDHVRRLLGMLARRFKRKRTQRTRRFRRRARHTDLVQIAVERSEVEQVRSAIFEEIAVDGVVIIAAPRFDARRSEVSERAAVHGRGCREADGAVLLAKGADCVVNVVIAADEGDVWRPEVLVSGELDAGARGQHCALVGPWARDGGCGVDCYLVAG